MNTTGVLLALCTALSWSIGIFPFTEAARRLGTQPLNHLRLFLAAVGISIVSLLVSPADFIQLIAHPNGEQWLWFGLSGMIGLSLGDYFSFGSFAILGPRVGSIFATLAPGTALLFGFLLLHEQINGIGIIGIILTIGGVIWIALRKESNHSVKEEIHGSLQKGIFFGVLSAICQGIGIVCAKKGLEVSAATTLSGINAAWLRMTIGFLTLLVFTIVTGRVVTTIQPILKNPQKGVQYAAVGTLFGAGIGIVLSMYAVALIDVSVAQTIFSLVPVMALPLAYLFHRERITFNAVIGAVIAITGVIILIWREQLASWLGL